MATLTIRNLPDRAMERLRERADADLLIAATCLARCDRLITGNTAHFERLPELQIENWLT